MDAQNWSASQYLKFEDERTRPASDLLAQVALGQIATAVDLGCGPGNSTELLTRRYPSAAVVGVDLSDAMLGVARIRLPSVTFLKGDAADWMPAEPVDLIFANALFQWVPNHIKVLAGLMAGLKAGGVLAVQMPDNLAEPTHVLMDEVAQSGAFASHFAGRSVRRPPLPQPPAYFDALGPQASRVDVWHTIYNHPLADAAAIVEWVKGTGLQPYLEAIPPEQRDAFLAAYLERIAASYPPMADGRVLLRFPRLFLTAVKA